MNTTDQFTMSDEKYEEKAAGVLAAAASVPPTPTETPTPVTIDQKALRSGMVKVDFIVTGFAILLYLMSFLDKANLGNAVAAGLQQDLGFSGYQYSIMLTASYPPYIFAEFPAALLMKKIGPHIMLPALTVTFGLITALQGLCQSYGALLACRVALALAEGGIIPSLCLYLATFYPREIYSLRCTLLFSATAMAGAWAGLLAAGLIHLDGTLGRPGWGVFTIAVALLAFCFMTPNIEKSRWLKEQEKVALRAKYELSSRKGEAHGRFSWAEVWTVFKHPFAWICVIVNLSNAIILFGMAFFLPTIVRTFGYSPTMTQLRTVPPYAVVFVVTIALSYVSDRLQLRGPFLSFYGTLAIIGCALNISSRDSSIRYAGLFLQIFGGSGVSPGLSTWLVDNAAPHYARGTQIAWCFTFTQIGGIISTWIYPRSEAPYYRTGAKVSMAAAVAIAIVPWIMMYIIRRTNKKREEVIAKLPEDHVFPEGPVGHLDVRFHYML